jgi:hypothetical protein
MRILAKEHNDEDWIFRSSLNMVKSRFSLVKEKTTPFIAANWLSLIHG